VGTNFGSTQGTSTVKFKGTTATVSSWSATSITATVPTGATTGNVVVTVNGVASAGVNFTVVPAPSIGSLTPNSGAVGSAIVIAGSNFGSTQGNGGVTFNGTTATVSSWSNTSITATVPTGATTGNVIVTAAGGVASSGVNFTVVPAPSITSLTPNRGAVGSAIVIAGSNFGSTQGNGGVTFNGTTATVSSWSNTSITATVPTGATTGNVIVTAAGGVASSGVNFTVVAAPSISSLTPNSGAIGSAIVIAGSNFGSTQGNGGVTFNGTTAAINSWSNTSITATVPTGATTGNVIVTAAGGVASAGVNFTVVPAPSITSLSPTSGPVGASVTITGTNFGSTQGNGGGTFNGTTATVNSWSGTSIGVTVPTGATTGNVVVTAAGGVASNGVSFTVLPTPSISSLTPNSGPVGSAIVIAGTNFGSTQGTSTVTFNGTTATASSWANTSITATVPTGATTGNVVVTVNGVASNGVSFTVLIPPSISGLSPTSGPVGAAVTISGSNFGASQGSSDVTFNGVLAAPTSWSAGSISAPVPAGSTSGNVVVTVGGLASNGISFTVTSSPTITSLTPSSGDIGTAISILGSNFGPSQGASTITFNGQLALASSWGPSNIIVPVPAGATTGNVVVTVGGQASNGVGFTVGPFISSLSPTSGPVGTLVAIIGNGFGAAKGTSTISFNGTSAGATNWSDSSITTTVPNGARTGLVQLNVGGQVSNGLCFGVPAGAPCISAMSPTFGNSGTAVILSGLDFGATQGTSSVTLNGVTAPISSWSASSIQFNVPSGATSGGVQVTVGGASSNSVLFTVPGTAPYIGSVSPGSGSGGTAVTISGLNFGSTQGSSTVKLNGVAATATNWNDTSVQFNVPVGVSSGNIVITVGGTASNTFFFTVPAPALSNISPDSGRAGTPITISGSSFGSAQGSSTITFNGAASTPTSWSDRTIAAPVPAGASTGSVIVTVAGQASAGVTFTVTSAPAITGISPNAAPVNTTVTISGSGFGAAQGGSTITFNGTAATPISWSDTSILAPVPAGATTGSVVVAAGGLNSNGTTFTVTPAPSITSLSASSGAPGTSITVSGANFGSSQGSSVVRFNGVAAQTTAWAAGSITAVVPTGATTGPVTVTVSGQISNGSAFTVITQGTLSGSVTNASGGGAISGATVQALQSGAVRGSATTNGTGGYTISSLPAGSYDVQASASGFGTALQSPISVVPAQTATVNFSLATAATLSGKVTQSDGLTAIPGAGVTVFLGRAVATAATTDASGNYSISGINSGSYSAQASAPGFVTKSQTVTLTAGNTTTANFALQTPGANPINYVYDELGRLVGVIDPSGDTATYTYDAVGNILAIARHGSSQLSIVSFTPLSAAVGATVTIYGTGFSATASQDSVSFNGTSAIVASATTTQIVTSVPAGATSGPITVTTPAGAVTSGTVFNVNAISTAPAITNFTPAVGLQGTAVTITGTNFDSSPPNNKVRFNGTLAPITSANTTSISTSVPSVAGSGHISVTTPNGTAVSSQDFFIPFLTSLTLSVSGRIAFGQTQSGSLSSSTSAMFLFDATAGQSVSFQESGTLPCFLYLIDPTGNRFFISGCSSFVAGPQITKTGTYALVIDPRFTSGTFSVTLINSTSVQMPLTLDGPAVTATTTQPGQNIQFTFQGNSGQHLNLQLSNGTFNNSQFGCTVSLSGQDGTQVMPQLASLATACDSYFINTTPLPKTQTYTLTINPGGGQTGSITARLTTPPADVVNTITVGGSAVSVNTPTMGQNGRLTFTGSSGQHVAISITSNTYANCALLLQAPDGTLLLNDSSCGASQVGVVLSLSGTYSIILAPENCTGGATVTLLSASDLLGSITANGTPVNVNTTVAGQDARLTFSGTAGQRISLWTTSTQRGPISLLRPDGTVQDTLSAANATFMGVDTLATTGTYTLLSAHNSNALTSETLQLYTVPADVTGTLAPGGSPFTVTLTAPGQGAALTFSGTAGQILSLAVTNSSLPSGECKTQILNPDGTVMLPASSSPTCFAAANQVLPSLSQTGTYTIQIIAVQNGANVASVPVGSLTLQLFTVTNITGTITIGGSPVTLNFTTPGQVAVLTFNSTSGQTFYVWAHNVTVAGNMSVADPSQNVIASNPITTSDNGFINSTPNPTGTFTLTVAPNLVPGTGNITVSIYNPPQNVTGTLTPGTPVTLSITLAGQSIILTFNGTAGQQATVHFTNSTFAPDPGISLAELLDPNGHILTEQTFLTGTGNLSTQTLPVTGTYSIQVAPFPGNVGGITVNVTLP